MMYWRLGMSKLLGLLVGWKGYAAAAILSAIVAGYLSYEITSAFNDRTISAMKLAQAKAEVVAWRRGYQARKLQDEVTRAADIENAKEQGRLEGNTKEIIRNVPIFITPKDDARCTLPWGFVRVLDAAGLGVPAAELPNRTAEPDSANSGIPLSRATALLAENLGDVASMRERLKNAAESWKAQGDIIEARHD